MSDRIVAEVEVEVMWEGHRSISESDFYRAEKGITIETELPPPGIRVVGVEPLFVQRIAERMLGERPMLSALFRVVVVAPLLTDLVRAYERAEERGVDAGMQASGVYDFLHETLRIGGLTPDWTEHVRIVQSWHRERRVKP